MLRPSRLAIALLLAAGPAHAQMPVKNSSSAPDGLPPMSAPQPVLTTPPDVQAVGSSPAAGGTQPSTPAPTIIAPPTQSDAAPPSSAPDAPPRRKAWGEGTTIINRDAKIGMYAAPTFAITSVNRLPGLMLGADFGLMLGERFSVGVAGKALVTPLSAQRSDGRAFNLRLPYAGVTLGVQLVRVKFFSVGVGVLLGGGRVCLNDERLDRCVNRAAMFVAEPEIGLHFAVTKFMRLVLSGGYRVVVAQSWSGPPNSQLGGLAGTLALRVGKF